MVFILIKIYQDKICIEKHITEYTIVMITFDLISQSLLFNPSDNFFRATLWIFHHLPRCYKTIGKVDENLNEKVKKNWKNYVCLYFRNNALHLKNLIFVAFVKSFLTQRSDVPFQEVTGDDFERNWHAPLLYKQHSCLIDELYIICF